jgi:hypothetical protein
MIAQARNKKEKINIREDTEKPRDGSDDLTTIIEEGEGERTDPNTSTLEPSDSTTFAKHSRTSMRKYSKIKNKGRKIHQQGI